MELEVKGVTVHYGNVAALRDISFKVEQGRAVALVGANGAGKTTALRTISGLNRPTSGEIWFSGRRIDHASSSSIVKAGVIHIQERRGLFPQMSVYENMLMGAYLCKSKSEMGTKLELTYELFPVLRARAQQRAGSLSGGEQQMLAIGRGLMANPKLLLVDEPSTGLSPLLVENMAEAIMAINRRDQVSLLLVEQNVSLALKITDRAHVLETGVIVLEGSSGDLLNNEDVRKAYLGG
jgi:branched-chain amino acid transport system ATP-binding protein